MNLSEINLSNFDLREAGDWPLAGKAVLAVLVLAAVLGAGYYFLTNDQLQELEKATREEQTLRNEFVEKWRVTANLEAFRQQIKQMEADLDVLLRQLPTSTEMPDLLEDVSNTGKKNGLEFELFKPEADKPKDFYAAKPITIKAKGNYHQFGAFVSGVAALSRIVTLESATLASAATKDLAKKKADVKLTSEPLTIQATLQTYRYMDEAPSAPAAPAGGPKQQQRQPPQKKTGAE
ncbi:MAG: type 4a pilus biogenesis protein PilO [Candidatus Contendobacter sp.]|nr:type 4a pilus biogenesis protein PilO [Candidatus Contendobacter sp.]MDG4557512.1 type 4a pilus biogenesis protein PilO [Candidatus Contendobacter sp.]